MSIHMWSKGSKLFSIFRNKCPRCQEGDFFVKPAGFRFRNNLKMHEKCSNCGLKYMLEPSFYYGAMYVSYALTVAMAVAVFLITYWLGMSLFQSLLGIVAVLVISNPFVMRLSRLLYINLFVHYQEENPTKAKHNDQ